MPSPTSDFSSLEAAPLHLACLLLVTDEHGTILGIDLLMDGAQRSAGKACSWTENLAPRAYALLCHSMACPMGSGDPRKPRQLTVGDAQLHRYSNLVSAGREAWGGPDFWTMQPDAPFTPIQRAGESGPKAGSEVSQDPNADMGSPARLHLRLPSGSNLPRLSQAQL